MKKIEGTDLAKGASFDRTGAAGTRQNSHPAAIKGVYLQVLLRVKCTAQYLRGSLPWGRIHTKQLCARQTQVVAAVRTLSIYDTFIPSTCSTGPNQVRCTRLTGIHPAGITRGVSRGRVAARADPQEEMGTATTATITAPPRPPPRMPTARRRTVQQQEANTTALREGTIAKAQ